MMLGILKRLSRRIFPEALSAMSAMPILEGENLETADAYRGWFTQLEGRLNDDTGPHGSYRVSVEAQSGNGFRAQIRAELHGLASERVLGSEFFRSSEYRNLVHLAHTVTTPLSEGARVERGDKNQVVGSIKEAMDWLLSEVKKGIHIQRYKGLGEMNPEQLWETTMNPETRRLLQVRIEDAVAADELFTTLMGDQVEPRREFIQTNALSVSNLDA